MTRIRGRVIEGIWQQVLCGNACAPSPLLLLDRDGVIVEEVNYLHRTQDVRLLDGVLAAIEAARHAGWRIAIVTNQAGIARGYFGWDEFEAVNEYILDRLEAVGAGVDCVLAAPHHPEGKGEYAVPNHPMRKPNPGMLQLAARLLGGDLRRSLMVGDNLTDLQAANAAGLSHAVLVRTGHGERHVAAARGLAGIGFEIHVVADVGAQEVIGLIKGNEGVIHESSGISAPY